MALNITTNFRWKGVLWKSGYAYKFHYTSWIHDPDPLIILMYKITGINQSTGHQWRLIQGINLNYIPRKDRKRFASTWITTLENNRGNVQFTWDIVKRKYPYLKGAVRRYLVKPDYYIKKPVSIPFENMEKAIISSWSKDFSKKLAHSLVKKFRKATKRKK